MIDRANAGAKLTAHRKVTAMGRATADASESGTYRLAGSASHLLHRAEQVAADRFTELVGDTVTLRQFAVLAAIAEAKAAANQSDLVRATGIDRSTLAEMLKRMQARGWITRAASISDKRAVSVQLTEPGASLLSGFDVQARAADAAILDDLPRTKRRALLSILTLLLKIEDEKIEKAQREARKQAKREAKERAKLRAKEKAKQKKADQKKSGKRHGARKLRGAS